MKHILIALALLLCIPSVARQKKPVASPDASFTQLFGESTITVQYARPLARGRKIFGTLVPFDSLWRTGAADCTTITFKEEVIIGGKKLPAGKYSIFTIPRAADWTVILNTDVSLHGAMGYDASKDVHRFTVKPLPSGRYYETFTIEINDFTPQGSASLNLIWENTLVPIPLESPWFVQSPVAEKPVAEKAEEAPKKEELIATVAQNAQLQEVYMAYFLMKDALVAENGAEAGKQAEALKKAVEKIDAKSFTAAQQATWSDISPKLKANASKIASQSGKIAEQRTHFIELSNSMIALAKAVPSKSGAVYVQHCPMANGNKGASWLSKDSAVRNPYFGSRMLACGKVKETIK